MGALCRAGIGRSAADIDDPAAFAALQHEGQTRPSDDKRAIQNDAGDFAPLLKGHLEERHLSPDRRVVDEYIEPTKPFAALLDHGTNRHLVGNFGETQQTADAELGDLVGDSAPLRLGGAGVYNDGRTVLRQPERDGTADSPYGTRHQGNFSHQGLAQILGHFRSQFIASRFARGFEAALARLAACRVPTLSLQDARLADAAGCGLRAWRISP